MNKLSFAAALLITKPLFYEKATDDKEGDNEDRERTTKAGYLNHCLSQ